MDLSTAVELRPTKLVAGGVALAREEGGRVVLVEGALPGEVVRVELTDERRDLARGRVVEVVEAGPDRTAPPCPEVDAGCGGCDLQHATPGAQRRLKAAVVVDALERIGRIDAPVVELGPDLPAEGYRTTIRCAVDDGRAGFRRRSSHDVKVVADCLVAHPLLAELIRDGRFGGADEVTLRAGARTGERLVVASPTAASVEVPDDVVVVGGDALRSGSAPSIHEEVAGRRYRVSAGSFFQSRPDGAEVLIEQVVALGGAELAGASTVVDAYAGVGLFTGALLDRTRALDVVAIEWSRPSVADLRHNVEGDGAQVIRCDVARWRPTPADVVVADPSRSGLGPKAAARLAGSGASALVLVSCDAAALGRDAGLLAAHGFRLERAVVVDLFPHTSHVEVVSRFVR